MTSTASPSLLYGSLMGSSSIETVLRERGRSRRVVNAALDEVADVGHVLNVGWMPAWPGLSPTHCPNIMREYGLRDRDQRLPAAGRLTLAEMVRPVSALRSTRTSMLVAEATDGLGAQRSATQASACMSRWCGARDETSAYLAEVYGATVSKEMISSITDRVLDADR
jgi:hypothetical protein